MSNTTHKMNLSKMPAGTTLHVEVITTRRLRVRMWIAKRLIRLAAWITGMGVEIR